MAATYKFILENEVISSTKGALVVVTAYWKALKNDFGKKLRFCPNQVNLGLADPFPWLGQNPKCFQKSVVRASLTLRV